MKLNRSVLVPLGTVGVLVVAASLTWLTPAFAQAGASLQASVRVVDAGAGWLAHVEAHAQIERTLGVGHNGTSAGRMAEVLLAGGTLPQPRVSVVRVGGDGMDAARGTARGSQAQAPKDAPAALTIYVEHVSN